MRRFGKRVTEDRFEHNAQRDISITTTATVTVTIAEGGKDATPTAAATLHRRAMSL